MTVRVGLHSRGHFIEVDRHPMAPRSGDPGPQPMVEPLPIFWEMGACISWNIDVGAPGANVYSPLNHQPYKRLDCSCSPKANFTAKRTQRWPDGGGWVVDDECPTHGEATGRRCAVCGVRISGRSNRTHCSPTCRKRTSARRKRLAS